MNECIRASRPRHPDRQGPGGAIERDAEAVIVLGIALDAPEMEVARIVGWLWPMFNQQTKGFWCRCDDAAVAITDREDVGRGCGAIGSLQARRQREMGPALRVDGNVS